MRNQQRRRAQRRGYVRVLVKRRRVVVQSDLCSTWLACLGNRWRGNLRVLSTDPSIGGFFGSRGQVSAVGWVVFRISWKPIGPFRSYIIFSLGMCTDFLSVPIRTPSLPLLLCSCSWRIK